MGGNSNRNDGLQNYQKVSKWFIMLSVLYVITGIVMMVWPNLTMELLGKVLGIGMLVVGLAYIIIYFTKDHLEGIMTMDLTIGVILAAFGAFMLLHSDFVEMAIPFAIGIVLLIGGISKIQYALDMRKLQFRHWNLMLIAACVMLVLGMVLVYNPFREKVLIYYIGITLCLDGILSIVGVLLISHRMKQISRGQMPMSVKGKNRNGDQIVSGAGSDQTQTPMTGTVSAYTQNNTYTQPDSSAMQVYQNGNMPARVIDADPQGPAGEDE